MKPSDLETPADILSKYCSKAKASTVLLYRGVLPESDNDPEYFVATIRQDRRPRSSSPESVAIFDKLMELNNWPFRKSNTLSTAQQLGVARRYGIMHEIYPFDDAYYLGSTKYEDFISIPSRIKALHKGYNSRDLEPTFEWMAQNLEQLNSVSGLFASHSLEDMQPSIGEILVYGTKYLAIRKRNLSDKWYGGDIGFGDEGTHF